MRQLLAIDSNCAISFFRGQITRTHIMGNSSSSLKSRKCNSLPSSPDVKRYFFYSPIFLVSIVAERRCSGSKLRRFSLFSCFNRLRRNHLKGNEIWIETDLMPDDSWYKQVFLISHFFLLPFELLQAKAITSSVRQKCSEWWSNVDTIAANCFRNETLSTRQDSAITAYAGSIET